MKFAEAHFINTGHPAAVAAIPRCEQPAGSRQAQSPIAQREMAVTNFNVMAGDFSEFANPWNQQLHASSGK